MENIVVVGAGLMGSGIVQVAAQAGHPTVMVDIEDVYLEKGMAAIKSSLKRVLRKKHEDPTMAEEEFLAVMGRIKASTDLEDAAASADIVVEAVTENLALKGDIFGRLDRAAPAHAVFASNTSSLPIAALAAATSRPDKVGGLHFFNPVPVMRLVEVVRAEETSDSTFSALKAFAEGVGKTAIACKDTPGFVVNRLLVPYLMEAVRLLERGDAGAEDIDTAMKLGCGYPMGPLALLDYVGLDTTKFILDGWHEVYPDQPLFYPSALLDRLVGEGKLGRKSGEGFYPYRK
ncbi:3-hydroxybutyryl-CoA dehydrogenase [bacterium]|nr:3-hydroxybutyryl-CoA dehydrogenase [bacterium]